MLFFLLLIFTSTLTAYTATNYQYDSLGRLIEVSHSSGKKVTYAYDAVGNMAAVVTTGGEISGYSVSGTVRSYNPNNRVTLELIQDDTVKCRSTIDAEAGSGQRDQSFTFVGVEPGTYTLVVTKAAHLKSTFITLLLMIKILT